MKKNIWEMDDLFLCPVSGFCLSPEEQQSILRKNLNKEQQRAASKKLHDFMIGSISSKTRIAKCVQKFLDHKYSTEISQYCNYDTNRWMAEIETFLNWEYFGAFIWISSMYINLNELDTIRIMNKIHSYSHQIYYELQDAEKEYINISMQSNLINEKYSNIRTRQKELSKELSILKAQNIQLTHENSALRNEHKSFTKKLQNESAISENLLLLEQKLKISDQTVAALKTENKQLTKKTSSQLALFLEIKNDFDKIQNNLKQQNKSCKACDRVNLCQRRVLIVGGITKMESFYRKLVQELGGDFYYHDGNCGQKESGLNHLVKQSDIVICPVDVNSHAACLQVKKTCKKTGTDYYMLRKSSINAIYSTLREVAIT